jgi:hypothetical protein
VVGEWSGLNVGRPGGSWSSAPWYALYLDARETFVGGNSVMDSARGSEAVDSSGSE